MNIRAKGLPEDELFDKLTHFADRDMPWREGKTLAYIYDGGADVERVAKRAYMQYLTENALDPTVYPSLARMERDLIGIGASLLGGDENVVGNFTSGGTESCMLAVKTARDWAPRRQEDHRSRKSCCRSPPMPPSTRAPIISASRRCWCRSIR